MRIWTIMTPDGPVYYSTNRTRIKQAAADFAVAVVLANRGERFSRQDIDDVVYARDKQGWQALQQTLLDIGAIVEATVRDSV